MEEVMGVLEGMNIISMSNEFNIFAQSHKLIYNINVIIARSNVFH